MSPAAKQRTVWADDPLVPDTRLFRPIPAVFRSPGARVLT